MLTIFDATHNQFVEAFHRRYGQGAHIGTSVYRQVMQFGRTDAGGMEALVRYPQLADRLARDLVPPPGRIVTQTADEGVVKFVTRLEDGLDIESVVIPMHRRNTLCISSQVGCRMGCRFCRTGRMGLIRQLTAAEIVGQVFSARHRLGLDVRNVVFMGMGEPLDNLDNVLQAVRVLSDQRGVDIARRYITVSTVGLVSGIERLACVLDRPVNLAVSLNAAADDVRNTIMPVNRTNPMGVLKTVLGRYPLTRKAALFVEYVLIAGVNDQPQHADALAAYLDGLPVKLNLIVYNPWSGESLRPPSADTVDRFHARLVDAKIFVRRRGEKGGRIMAACGQLGGRAAAGHGTTMGHATP